MPTYGILDWVTQTALPWVGEKVTGLIGGRYGGDEGLKNLGTDAMSIWAGLEAKKSQEEDNPTPNIPALSNIAVGLYQKAIV